MKKITELYHFEKFWNIFIRQDRTVSKWEEKRTDMDVFIRRTIKKWFSGRTYQIEIERHKKQDALSGFFPAPTEYRIFTKYIHIIDIDFAFLKADQVKIFYVEPHGEKWEVAYYQLNDFLQIKLVENEEDFRILRKFFPVKLVKYETKPFTF